MWRRRDSGTWGSISEWVSVVEKDGVRGDRERHTVWYERKEDEEGVGVWWNILV